jgi:hypothetical protein
VSRHSIAKTRRRLQVALGAIWLLDAALQFQPFMFGRGFALEVLKPTAAGNPSLIARPLVWSAQVVLAEPQLWNTIFALTQLLLALGLFWRRSVKLALAGTVAWSLIVWWLGEGLGGVLAGAAAPLMGAPGAVVLYALLALLLWPRSDDEGRSLAETSILAPVAVLAWLVLWAGEAYFALLPANDSAGVLHGMLAGMANGEPHPIAALDRQLANVVAYHGTVGPGLGVLFALCALAVLLPARIAKPLFVLAMVLAVVTWVGQDFGGIFTGQGTDPNSGPLLFLLALAYWPIRPQASPATAARRRPPPLRIGIAVAAAAVVGASSLAAATGVTTATAAASNDSTRLSATLSRMFGPGPLVGRSALAGYRISFRDAPNRPTRPGVLSLDVRRNGQAVDGAKVRLTFRSLDMNMTTHTITLLSRGQGRYSSNAPLLGMGGRWRITVSVLPRQGRALLLSLTDLVAD